MIINYTIAMISLIPVILSLMTNATNTLWYCCYDIVVMIL